MNGKWDSHHPHSCSAASAVRYVVIAATLLLKARGWFCVNVIQCWESSVPMLSSANHPGMCYAVLSTQRSVLECKVVTDSPALERKKKCLFLKILVPCPHASISVQISIWGIDTQCMEPYSFFFSGEFSKQTKHQSTNIKKRAFLCDYSVTGWALFVILFFPYQNKAFLL